MIKIKELELKTKKKSGSYYCCYYYYLNFTLGLRLPETHLRPFWRNLCNHFQQPNRPCHLKHQYYPDQQKKNTNIMSLIRILFGVYKGWIGLG